MGNNKSIYNPCTIQVEQVVDEKQTQTFKFSESPYAIYVRPDLSKLVLIGSNGDKVITSTPFYSIYDVATNTQIELQFDIGGFYSPHSDYCFGYFHDDQKTFIFCIGMSARKVFSVDTDTGQYTQRVVNHAGIVGNESIDNIIDMHRNSYLQHNIDQYRLYMLRNDGTRTYFAGASTPYGYNYKGAYHTSAIDNAYLMEYMLPDSQNILLICGFIRSIRDDIFPQELIRIICHYKVRNVCVIAHSNRIKTLKITELL